jgi:hypothetical protein
MAEVKHSVSRGRSPGLKTKNRVEDGCRHDLSCMRARCRQAKVPGDMPDHWKSLPICCFDMLWLARSICRRLILEMQQVPDTRSRITTRAERGGPAECGPPIGPAPRAASQGSPIQPSARRRRFALAGHLAAARSLPSTPANKKPGFRRAFRV